MFCVFVGCLPGITQPGFFRGACGALRWRGRGAVPSLAAPPAHGYSSDLTHIFFVLMWTQNLNVYHQKVVCIPPIFS